MKRLLIALACSASFAVPAMAQSDAELTDALSNVQHEMARCIAYNTIVAGCVRPQDTALADKYDQVAEHLLPLSHQAGYVIGMSQDAIDSRLLMEYGEMKRLIQNSCTNISSLISRHAYPCKQVTENADSVLLEYLERR
ncbi:hypothetical protein [Nitratireductor luteus]|uniref:hypothetical protein n=1 Tax=Nitratireductor luteus TaxID=2976980 RepID=UPI002240D0FE|nr:hypothetical protein [Nitratireductor luteus]